MRKLAFLFLIVSAALFAQTPPAQGQAQGQGRGGQGQAQGQAQGRGGGRGPQNLVVLPENTSQAQIIPIMETFEVSLGVQCTYCHVPGNFASDDNMRKNAARGMMRVVAQLNKNFTPDGKEHIGCWTCHRGSAKPEVTPPQNLIDEAAKALAAAQGGGRGAAPAPEQK